VLPSFARKFTGQNPKMFIVFGGLRAFTARFGNFKGVGIWGLAILTQGVEHFFEQGCGSGHARYIICSGIKARVRAGKLLRVTVA